MDHSLIDAEQVAERYLLGQLPPDEAARFEEHSLACPECLDRLETAETLRLGLRAVAAREAAAGVVRLSLLARLARSRLAPWGVGFLFLAAVLPSFYLTRETGRLDRELARTREELAQRPVPVGHPGLPPAAGEAERQAELARLRAQIAERDRQAEAERRERERLAADLARAKSPRINVPVVPLSPERSAPGGEPTARLALSPSTEWVVLSLELDAPGYPSYRATLAGPDGRTLWRAAGLHPDAQEALTVALAGANLPAGVLSIRVDGLPAQGAPVPVAGFSFRVVRTP